MNRTYRLIWNKTYFCWQAVSELAKSTTASKQSPSRIKSKATLSLITKRIGLLTINLLSASIALAGPTGGVVSSGAATISTTGSTTTINQSTAKAAIDWSSFSSNSNEAINFVQPNSSSITLNRVTGNSISTLNGQLNANGQVFIINPNGVLFGSTSQVNTGGLVASTLNLSNSDFNSNSFKFSNAANNKTVENRGKITVPVGGTVALIAPSVRQTGTIKAPQGNVLFAAGGDITLNLNNGSLLGYTINHGKAQALINSGGMIQADGGKVVLTAKGLDELSNAVVNSVGVVQAQTVNNVRGVIELGSDLVSGTVNVSGTLDASAPTSGNGGQIKTTASNVQISTGTNITTQRNTTSSLPPTTSGWELQAKNIDIDFFGGSVSSTTLGNALNKGNVTLSAIGTGDAQGIINLNDATNWSNNTALTLNATKDINFNSDLDLSGDKAKLAMNYGIGSDYNLNNGSKINISGSAPTLLINGTSYIVINNLGEEGDASINTLQGMKNNLSGNYALGSNIDASDTVNWNDGKGFDPIGKYEEYFTIFQDSSAPGGLNITQGVTSNPFNGKFHGLGHEINSLNINRPNSTPAEIPNELPATFIFNSVGLFGASSDLIRDIGITDSKVTGTDKVGALVGVQLEGMIKNSSSSATVVGSSQVGGLVGASGLKNNDIITDKTLILNSSSTGQVSGDFQMGGLVGLSLSHIENSFSNVSLNFDDNKPRSTIGGLVGELGGIIINSYSLGGILGRTAGNVGGLVGLTNGSTIIKNSYSMGDVEGRSDVGGLVGNVKGSSIIDSTYSMGNIKGERNVGGLIGVTTNSGQLINSKTFGNTMGDINTGGLIGIIQSSSSNNIDLINNSHTKGTVTGNSFTGGLVGYIDVAGVIKNSSVTGNNVIGDNSVGGLIGFSKANIENSSVNTDVSGISKVGGIVGVLQNANISNSYMNGDLHVENKNIGNYVGGLVGLATNSLIESSHVNSNIYADGIYVGGVVGSLTKGEINNSSTKGSIHSQKKIVYGLEYSVDGYVGGLVGLLNNGDVNNSNSQMNINSNSNYVGGLVGLLTNNSRIIGSSSSGNIEGINNIGGLAGSIENNSLIMNSHNSGSVQGWKEVGGLTGQMKFDGSIISSYNLGNILGVSKVDKYGANFGSRNIGGLVGYMSEGNLSIENSYNNSNVYSKDSAFTGGLIGRLGEAGNYNIINSYAEGDIKAINEFDNFNTATGGLIGGVSGYSLINPLSINIKNSYNLSSVQGNNQTGGLVGAIGLDFWSGSSNIGISIKNSFNKGVVIGGASAGGLVGYASSDLIFINNSHNLNNVVGSEFVGGLIGFSKNVKINDSYNNGHVTGVNYIGGVLGGSDGSEVHRSFNKGNINGEKNIGGLIGESSSTTLYDSHNDGDVNGTFIVGGMIGAGHNYSKINSSYNSGNVKG